MVRSSRPAYPACAPRHCQKHKGQEGKMNSVVMNSCYTVQCSKIPTSGLGLLGKKALLLGQKPSSRHAFTSVPLSAFFPH